MRTIPSIARLAFPHEIRQLSDFIASHRSIVAVTGAGCSTEAGLPDYRSPVVGAYARNHKPITWQEFVASEEKRRRFWLRSFLGFAQHRVVKPALPHLALVRLEQARVLRRIVTQNVDGLHAQAGSRDVVELHGSLDSCRCIACKQSHERLWFQGELQRSNPWLDARLFDVNRSAAVLPPKGDGADIRPDGDVDVAHTAQFHEALQRFVVPACGACGGAMQPNFVFFGGTVDAPVAAAAEAAVESADGVLVLGTSASTLSCMRLLRKAEQRGTPMAIVSAGESKADALRNVHVRLFTRIGFTLMAAVETALTATSSSASASPPPQQSKISEAQR